MERDEAVKRLQVLIGRDLCGLAKVYGVTVWLGGHLNNLGLILGRQGDLDGAEPYFRKALQKRPGYGEAANNLALVLVNRGRADEAIRLLQGFLEKNPSSERTYVTLAKVYLGTDRRREGLETIDRLLQRNPVHPQALEIARQFR